MPGRIISRDLKLAAMNLLEHGRLSRAEICDCVGFSKATFQRVLAIWRETGDVVRPSYGRRGRRRILIFTDVQYLCRLVNQRPDWFLDELLELLDTNRFISVHYTTVYRELERAGMSRKKLKKIAAERNELLRSDFIRKMADYTPDQLVFVGGASKGERTLQHRYGRSKKGKRAVRRAVFVRGRRVTGVGALSLDGMVSADVFEGSLTRETYLRWLEDDVV
jgi:transposase